jgi:hypothetical protein
MTFLEGSAPALPKNFGASGVVWRVGLLPDRKFSAHQEMRPPVTGFWAYSIVIKIVGFGTK